jgi:hypothetical protein
VVERGHETQASTSYNRPTECMVSFPLLFAELVDPSFFDRDTLWCIFYQSFLDQPCSRPVSLPRTAEYFDAFAGSSLLPFLYALTTIILAGNVVAKNKN